MKKSKVNTYHNPLDPLQYIEKVKVQGPIRKKTNAGIWYDPVTEEEELA